MSYQKGILLIVISAVCYGFIPIFTLYAYQEGLKTLDFLFYRYLVATIIFFLYMIVRRIRFRLSWTQIFWLFIIGAVFNLLQSIFFVSSVKYISAGLTTLLFYIHPLLVAVLSYFEGEKLSKGIVIAIFVSFGGLLLVLGTSFGEVNMLGVALSLAAAVFYTGFIMLGNRAVKDVEPLVMTSFVSLFTLVALLPLTLIYGGGLGVPTTAVGWMASAGCGIVTSNIALFTFFAGITVVGATTSTILSNIEPVATVILSALLFSQMLMGMQFFGGVLILAGGTIAVLAKKQTAEGS